MGAHRVYFPNRKNRFLSKVRKIKTIALSIVGVVWFYVSDLVSAITILALIFLSLLFFLAGA